MALPEPLTVQIARLAVDGGKLLGAMRKRGALLHRTAQRDRGTGGRAEGLQMGREDDRSVLRGTLLHREMHLSPDPRKSDMGHTTGEPEAGERRQLRQEESMPDAVGPSQPRGEAENSE